MGNHDLGDLPINACAVQCSPDKMERGLCTCYNLLCDANETDNSKQQLDDQ